MRTAKGLGRATTRSPGARKSRLDLAGIGSIWRILFLLSRPCLDEGVPWPSEGRRAAVERLWPPFYALTTSIIRATPTILITRVVVTEDPRAPSRVGHLRKHLHQEVRRTHGEHTVSAAPCAR